MTRWTSRLFAFFALLFVLWCGIFSIAMLSQLADAADRLYPGAGQPTFWFLAAILALTVVVPTIWLLRLPPALRYPTQSEDKEVIALYQRQLRKHLARNPQLHGHALESDADVAHALAQLQSLAEAKTKRTAASVFSSTALLQNGRLDGLVVLISQVQLVWHIARLYGLRPSLRQISYLYSNVGACVLIASNLDDVDFTELTGPIVQSVTPAAMSSVPGLAGMGHLLTNSLASGAANAFLTLRVGLIAAAYCAPQHAPDRKSLRQGATHRAALLLGSIVKDCGTQVTQAVYGRVKSGILNTAQAAADSVKDAGRSAGNAAQSAYQATAQGLQQAATKMRHATSSTTQRLQRSITNKPKDGET